jgi:hypothetical protein
LHDFEGFAEVMTPKAAALLAVSHGLGSAHSLENPLEPPLGGTDKVEAELSGELRLGERDVGGDRIDGEQLARLS